MDRAHSETDKMLEQMERELTTIYSNAHANVQKEWLEYMELASEELAELQEAYDKAKKAGDVEAQRKLGRELRAMKKEYTVQNDRYKQVVERTALELANVNEIATAYINGQLPPVYALNYNYFASGFSKRGVSFSLIDTNTVKHLATTDKSLLPQYKLNVNKDVRWNTKRLNSEVLQGILQGDSIPKIANRLERVENMNKNASIRTARTMVTSAENKGRMDMLEKAESEGIICQKVWISQIDTRTRDSHIELDGQPRDKDEPFENSVGKIMYPGDPSADAANVYNCFVGETNIASDCDIIRSYKSKYQGELVTVKTASGVCFTCTPNHPILTMSGWVSAKSLDKGDDLIIARCRDNVFSRINPNINHRFPRIDTIHKFFDVSGGERAVSMSVNFHGDIPTSDVEIITQKRFLRDNINSSGFKGFDKLRFKASYKSLSSKCTLVKHLFRVGTTATSFVRRLCELLAFAFGCLRHSEIHSLRPIAWLDSNGIKPLNDDVSRNAELICESLNGFSGLVFSDNIVSVDFSSGSTHVYNLQTQNGHYFVNSIITQHKQKCNGFFAVAHNCRCSLGYEILGFKKLRR